MTIFQEVLLGLIAVFGWCEYVDGINKSTRPIVMCTLVGLVLGDLSQGVIIGGTLELATMGMMGIGILIPINITIAGVLGAGFAIAGGLSAEAAVALAIIGIIVVVAIAIPENIMNAIGTGTNLLAALGFAMLFNLTRTSKTMAFFFIGFALASYLGMPTMAIAILGAAAAAIAFFFGDDRAAAGAAEDDILDDFDDLDDEPAALPAAREHLLGKKELSAIFFKSFGLEGPFIYSRLQAIGWCRSMLPAIEKLYDTDEERCAAVNRHLEFFNSNPEFSTFIMGISASMEEQNAVEQGFDTASINNVKAGLMGPLAGIGDSFWWGIVKTVASGIGCQFAMQGNVLGPILFLLVFNIPHWAIRYILTFKGYELGHRVLDMMAESDIIEKISLCAGILGMMVIGAMTCDMISVSTPLVFNMANEVTLEVQAVLDEILPNLLPLLTMLGVAELLKRKVKVIPLIFGLLAFGIVFNLLGIIA